MAGHVSEHVIEHPMAVAPFAALGALSIATYVAPLLVQNLIYDNFPVDLRKKYNAQWAVVTGASSGKKDTFS